MTREPRDGDRDSRVGRFSDPVRTRLLDVAVGGVVLIAYATLQLLFLQGPHPYDPAKYFTTAAHFPDIPKDLWTLRIGLVWPVRVAVTLFGPSEAALYAVPLAAGLLLAGAVYATMLVLFKDRVVAAAAALAAALNTNYLLNSSFIFPDTLATSTFATGFFFLTLGGERLEPHARAWVGPAAAIAAGVLFGWTYLVREFSPVLLPAVVVAVALLRYSWHRLALLVAAAIATASLELLYGLLKYGQPFAHIEELLSRGGEPPTSTPGRAARIQGELENPLESLLVLPRLLLAWHSGWVMVLLVVVLVATAAWLRDWRLWLLASWFLGFWAVMAILGAVTFPSGRWILNLTNIRYWYPILPALVMGSFGGLYLLMRRVRPTRRGAVASQLVVVALSALVLAPGLIEFDRCADRNVWRNDPSAPWTELRSWFATPEARSYDVVYANRLTLRLLPAFVRSTFGHRIWDGKLREFPDPPEQLIREDSSGEPLILIHKRWLPSIRSRLDYLRGEWFPRFVSADGRIVVLARRSTSQDARGPVDAWWLPAEQPRDETKCGLSPY